MLKDQESEDFMKSDEFYETQNDFHKIEENNNEKNRKSDEDALKKYKFQIIIFRTLTIIISTVLMFSIFLFIVQVAVIIDNKRVIEEFNEIKNKLNGNEEFEKVKNHFFLIDWKKVPKILRIGQMNYMLSKDLFNHPQRNDKQNEYKNSIIDYLDKKSDYLQDLKLLVKERESFFSKNPNLLVKCGIFLNFTVKRAQFDSLYNEIFGENFNSPNLEKIAIYCSKNEIKIFKIYSGNNQYFYDFKSLLFSELIPDLFYTFLRMLN